jgi:hypothetical protein
MKRIGRLAAVALTMSFAAVAVAQEPPPEQEEPPPQGDAPPPVYAPPVYAPPASYQAPSPPATLSLGAAGQIAISDDLRLIATHQSQSFMGQSSNTTMIILNPAVDVFVAPNLSLGGEVLVGLSSSGGNDSTAIGIAPRIGYNIPFGSMVSLWPRILVRYVHDTNSSSGAPSSTSNYTVSLLAFVPVLFQPAPHFFIGGGPYFSKDLTSKLEGMDWYKNTLFGVQSTIGGYFGGM